MASKQAHYDVHIMDPHLGHIESEDCWCEPCQNYWIQGLNGKLLHVLEHNDVLAPEANSTWVKTILDNLK